MTATRESIVKFRTLAHYKRFAVACSKDAARPSLAHPLTTQGVIAATDGRRLHAFDFGRGEADPEASFVLPAKLKGKVQLGVIGGKAQFLASGEIEDCPEPSCRVPVVRQVIPQDHSSALTLPASDMLGILKGIKPGPFPAQRAILSPEGLTIRATWTVPGGRVGSHEFLARPTGGRDKIEGELPTIGLDPVYLREALAFLADYASFVRLEFIDEQSPLVIRPGHPVATGEGAPLAVVMPIRL